MALTAEILRGAQELAQLTDEQVSQIVTLSVNDENAVIAARIGRIYGDLDADILAASGVAKNGTEKTYDYAKRVIGDLKATTQKVTEAESKLAETNAEVERLKKVIADGKGDEETRRALTQAQADLEAMTSRCNILTAEAESMKKQHAEEIFGVKMDNALEAARAGLKFKEGISEAAASVLFSQVAGKVRGMKPEFVTDNAGKTVLVFKDENGAILRNPNNALNPFTAAELIGKELKTLGVLDEGRQVRGAGSSGGTGGTGGTGGGIDLSGARTQAEAYTVISKGLMAMGLTRGSQEFDAKMREAWKESEINKLPEK